MGINEIKIYNGFEITVIAVLILGICFCCIRRCFRKRRAKDGKKGMKGVDLKSVQLLGSSYKEKVMSLQIALKDFFIKYITGSARYGRINRKCGRTG